MKEGWTYKKLGEVCEVISGQSPEGKYYNTERKGIPFYQGKKDFSLKYIGEPTMWTTDVTKIAEKDDLLMSVRAPVGDVNFATQRLCIGRGLAAIRTKGKVDKEYLFYFLLAKKNNIKGKEGVGFASINRKEIMDIDIHYPDDLSEQLSIVARLDAAFAHVDSLKANAEKQLAEARQLFQAELAECMRPKEGWEEKTLGSICKVINGRAYSKDEMLKQGKYRLLRVGNFFTNDSWYYSDLELEEDKYCEKGDLLFAWSASFGPRIWDGEKVIYHYHIWKMVCSSVVDKYFMFYWLDSDELKKQTMSNLHGATMAHITKGIIEAALVSYPSIELQYQIVSRLDALSANIKKLEEVQRKTLAECDALKQAMLREVFE